MDSQWLDVSTSCSLLEASGYVLTIEKLGWTPAHQFEEGIRETICWYLNNQAWVKAVMRK